MSKKDDFLLTMPTMSDDVEVVGKPKGKEYTDEEIGKMRSELTFYGSSKWKQMIAEWQKEHPLVSKVLSIEEKTRADYEIQMLNKAWREIQKTKKDSKSESAKRIEELWVIADNKKDLERQKLKQSDSKRTKQKRKMKNAKPK